MSCGKKLEVDKLKAKYIYSKSIKSKKGKFCTGDINNLKTDTLEVKNFFLNGQDLTCVLNKPGVSNFSSGFDPVGPTGCNELFVDCPLKPDRVNQLVWEALLDNAVSEAKDLAVRVGEGRDKIIKHLEKFSCAICPPPGATGPADIEIYATKTLPVFDRRICGSTGTVCGPTGPTGYFNTIITSMNYNLDVNYDIDFTDSVDSRLVSLLIQVAYIDPMDPFGTNVIIDTVLVANRQFTPTLDTLYGENFSGNVSIPLDEVITAVRAMPDPCNTGAVQLVVFKEKGLCIWTSGGDDCRSDPPNAPTGNQTTNLPPCNGDTVAFRDGLCA